MPMKRKFLLVPLLLLSLSVVDVSGASAATTKPSHRTATTKKTGMSTKRVCRKQGGRTVCRGSTTRKGTSTRSKGSMKGHK